MTGFEVVSLTPQQALGIPVALAGSVFLAVGTQLQHQGVQSVTAGSPAKKAMGLAQLGRLAARPAWLVGTLLLGAAVLLQLISLFLAPLTVVQPLGAVALVMTAVLNARLSRVPLNGRTLRGIGMSVAGVGIFVTVAAMTTASQPIGDGQLVTITVILGALLALVAAGFTAFRRMRASVLSIAVAGVLFGFVATLAKVVIDRIHLVVEDHRGWVAGDMLTIVAVIGLVVAAIIGSYFVQIAHSSGPPTLVVAGLTVIDPIVGVTVGIVVLNEAASAPVWAAPVFVLAGAVAVLGVFELARGRQSSQIALPRGAEAIPGRGR